MQTARPGAQTKRQDVAGAGEEVASRQNLTGRLHLRKHQITLPFNTLGEAWSFYLACSSH
jgi:hypothetical protein